MTRQEKREHLKNELGVVELGHLPWKDECRFIGSRHSIFLNENIKIVTDLESLNEYCKHCVHKEKCMEIVAFVKDV